MNAVLWWLAENTLAVALMIPPVLLLCRLFRARPAVQHTFWLVLLVKLVLPPFLEVPWLAENIAAWSRPAAVVAEPLPPPALEVIGAVPQGTESTTEATQADEEPVVSLAHAAQALFVSWCVGCGIACFVHIRRVLRQGTLIRAGTLPPRYLDEQIDNLAGQMGLRPIRAVVVSRIASPFVWCFGKLRLIWPAGLSTEPDVRRSRGVIAHELAHVRRRDHWVARLEFAAGLLLWWNPLFWFVRRRLRETAEWACDAMALGALPDERRAYAEMFLELSSSFPSAAPAPVLGMSAGLASSFERRLSMILSEHVSGKNTWRGIVVAGLLAVLAAPSWTIGQSSTAPPPPLTDFERRLLQELQRREQDIKAAEAKEAVRRAEAERDDRQALEKANRDTDKKVGDVARWIIAARDRAKAEQGQADARLLQAKMQDLVAQLQLLSKDVGDKHPAAIEKRQQLLQLENQLAALAQANQARAQAEEAANKAQALRAEAKRRANTTPLETHSKAPADETLVKLKQSLINSRLELNQLLLTHGADHPKVIATKRAMDDLDTEIRHAAAEPQRPSAQVKADEKNDQANMQRLKQTIEALERDKVALQDQVKSLQARASNAAASAPKATETSIFQLTNLKAKDMAKVLIDLFARDGGTPATIVAEPATNSLLFRGTRDQMNTAEALIARLEDSVARRKESPDAGAKGKTSAPGKTPAPKSPASNSRENSSFKLKHASAAEVAKIVLSVYRDNDLAVVADPASNTLLVRAAPELRADVVALIQQLDSQAADSKSP